MKGALIIGLGLAFAIYGQELTIEEGFHQDISNYDGEERIIGGDEAVNHSQPWMIYIDHPDSLCGGALIDPQWVLTAAHCVDEAASVYTVVAGTNQVCVVIGNKTFVKYGEGQKRTISKIYMKDYNNVTWKNDIALVKLKKPYTLSKIIKTIPLATKDYNIGDKLQISGWGDTYAGSEDIMCLLRTVELPVVSQTECKKTHKTLFPTHLCAGYKDGHKGICDGDSGGPLVDLKGKSPVLVGVLTLGTMNCTSYSVYSMVKSYSAWIKDTMKK